VELWLFLSIVTILCWGIAQVLTKKATIEIGPENMLILYMFSNVTIWTMFWAVRNLGSIQTALVGQNLVPAVASGLLNSFGMILFYEAVRAGPISLVGAVTAMYPAATVTLALILLGEQLSAIEGSGIVIILGSLALIHFEEGRWWEGGNRKWLPLAMMTFVLWGAGSVFAKVSVDVIGSASTLLIYALTTIPCWGVYWYLQPGDKRSFSFLRNPKWITGLASVILFSVGSIMYYSALKFEYVAVVNPVVSLYPVATVILAHFTIGKELKGWRQIVAIVMGTVGIVILAA
jgi:drug/metabolite transporter (DMT)-like permease